MTELRADAGEKARVDLDRRVNRTSSCLAQTDITVSLCLILLVALSALFDRHVIVRRFFTVDDSWALDTFFKAHQGVWLGRDVVFSYGPLYQWLLQMPAHLSGFSLGSFFRYGHVGLFVYSQLVILVSVRLLLRYEAGWRRALLILGLTIPWTYFEVREATILLLFALMLYLFDGALNSSSRLLFSAALGSGVLAFAFLISGDSGVYGIAALIIVAGSYCIAYRSNIIAVRKIVRLGVFISAGLLGWAALLSAFLGFRYWRDTLAVTGTYRWSMALPFDSPAEKWELLLVLGTCSLVFAAAWYWRKSQARSLAGRPVFLLAAPLFSLACLQSSIVRADWPHVTFGWFSAVTLAAFSLFAEQRFSARRFSYPPVAAGFALLVLYISPRTFFLPNTIAASLRPALHKPGDCPSGDRYLDGICVAGPSFAVLQGVATFAQAHSAASDSVAIFPTDNIYGDVARRRVAGAVLQTYIAAGDLLVRRQLTALEKQKPLLAVYSTDQQSIAISDVPNLTRSPDTWLYLQSHYRTAAEIKPGILILRQDDERWQRWRAQFSSLVVKPAAKNMAIGGATDFEIANQISWPASADLLRIRLLVRYPLSWSIGKPSSLSVVIRRMDGTVKRIPTVLPPNRETDLWVYPGDDSRLGSYFSQDADSWRVGSGSPVRTVSISISPMDWFSALPVAISIHKIEAVSLGLSRERATP